MNDVINRRMAARLEQLAIERFLRVATVTDRIGEMIEQTVAQATAPDQSAEDIAEHFRALPDRMIVELDDMMTRLAVWTHAETVQVTAAVVPRTWLRTIQPAGIMVGEQEVADKETRGRTPVDRSFSDIWPGRPAGDHIDDHGNDHPQIIATEADDDDQDAPVVRRMTDAEWANWVGEQVLPPLSREEVKAIVHADVNGRTWQQRLRGLSSLIEPEKAAAIVIDGYAQGLDAVAISKTLLPHIKGQVKTHARRIAHTESMRVSNTAQLAMYKNYGDLLRGVQILARMDATTRPTHALRNGRIYYTDGYSQPDISMMPSLPDAPNCRCFHMPVLRTPMEVEFKLRDTAEFRDAGSAAIPDPAEYSQWFLRADEHKRKQAVGAKRYNLLKEKFGREPDWSDFIDESGRLLPPATLSAETPDEYRKRKWHVLQVIDQRRQLIQEVAATGFVDDSPGSLLRSKRKLPRIDPDDEYKHSITKQRVARYKQVTEANRISASKLRTQMQERVGKVDRNLVQSIRNLRQVQEKLNAIDHQLRLPENQTVSMQAKLLNDRDKAHERRSKLMKEITPVLESRRKAAFAVLAVDDPATIRVHESDELPDAHRSKINSVMQGLQSVVSRKHSSNGSYGNGKDQVEIAFHLSEEKRSAHDPLTRRISLSRLAEERTIAHEFGHALEQFGEVHEVAKGFLFTRVGNEELKSISNSFSDDEFDEDERGREDEFAAAWRGQFSMLSADETRINASYTGKHYPQDTEVLSMGVELLFDDPAGFSLRDPEWFDFVVGVIRGDLLP